MESKVSEESNDKQRDMGVDSPKLQKQMNLATDRIYLMGQMKMAERQVKFWIDTLKIINDSKAEIDGRLKDLADGEPGMSFGSED